MRILMLSPYIPWPLNGGPPIRIYYVLRELVRHGHEVVLLAGHDGPSLPATHLLHTLCREIATYQPPSSARSGVPFVSALRSLASPLPYVAAKFGARYIQESIQRLAEKHEFDLIWANFAFMAYAVPPELCGSTPLVLDEHESEGLLWRQYLRHGSLAKRAFAVVNLIKLPPFRKRLMSGFRGAQQFRTRSGFHETVRTARRPGVGGAEWSGHGSFCPCPNGCG